MNTAIYILCACPVKNDGFVFLSAISVTGCPGKKCGLTRGNCGQSNRYERGDETPDPSNPEPLYVTADILILTEEGRLNLLLSQDSIH